MNHDHRSFAAARAYQGGTADRIRRFLPMVRRLAWHVHGSGRAGIEVEDLVQAGLVALTECAQKHNAPTEDGFAAYAKLRVRGAMVDLVRRSTPLSRAASDRRRLLAGAAQALTTTLGRAPSEDELAEGRIYPSLKRIHEVSHKIAVAVAEEVYAAKLNTQPRPADLPGHIRAQMFKPEYPDYCKK